MSNFLRVMTRVAIHAATVTTYAVAVLLVVALLWAMFAVEPGVGWSWPM